MKSISNIILIIIIAATLQLLYLSLYWFPASKVSLLVAVSVIASFLFIVLIIFVRKISRFDNRSLFIFIVAAGLLARLSIISVERISSDDVYRYMWDGKVQASGINPYQYPPTAIEVAELKSAVLPAKVSYPEMKTIYPPLAQIYFTMAYFISGENEIGFKLLLFLSECLTLYILYRILRLLHKPTIYIALYSLCPLPILQFMIDSHLDAIAFPYLLLFIYFMLKSNHIKSAAFHGLAIVCKLLPLIFIPHLLRSGTSKKNKIIAVTLPILITILIYLPYTFSGYPFESLGIFSSTFFFNGAVFSAIYPFAGNAAAHLIVGIIFILLYVMIFLSKKDILTKIYLSLFIFLLCSPTVHPWYVAWIAILLPFYFRWSGVVFVVMVSVSNFIYIGYINHGVWAESGYILLIEYVPVIIIFVYELASGKYNTRFLPAESTK